MIKNQGGLGEAAVQGGGGDVFPYHKCPDYHCQEGQKPGEDAKISFFIDVFCQRLLEQIKEPENQQQLKLTFKSQFTTAMHLPSKSNGKVAHVADHQGEPCDYVKDSAKCSIIFDRCPPIWEGQKGELQANHGDFQHVYLLLKQEQPQYTSPLGIGCHLKGIINRA